MPIYRMATPNTFVNFQRTPFTDLERDLEDWIEANPHLLFTDDQRVAIFSRQARTIDGKYLDLLGIDAFGQCVVIELKRGQAPRDVVAQALEYAAWVDGLGLDDLDRLAREYLERRNRPLSGLVDIYRETFSSPSSGDNEEPDSMVVARITFNARQRLVIVAEDFTPEVEQTLRYLRTKLGVDITGLRFSVHRAADEIILQTETVVGRESVANAVAKATANATQSSRETDAAILERVTTPFMKHAVTAIEHWVEGLEDPNWEVSHGSGSDHYLKWNGRRIAYYYYAREWIYCMLERGSDAESAALLNQVNKPDQVKEVSGTVRFHVANDDDFEALKAISIERVQTMKGG